MSSVAVFLLGQPSGVQDLKQRIREEWCAIPDDNNTLWIQDRVHDLETLGEEARLALLHLAESDEDRECAHFYLYELGERRQVASLREIASSPTERTRLRAVAVGYLGGLNDEDSIDMLIGLLAEGDKDLVRVTIGALGGIDDDRARQRLRQLATDADYSYYLVFLLRAIGSQRDVEAIDILKTQVLRTDSAGVAGEILVYEASLALARIETAESFALALDGVERMTGGHRKADAIQQIHGLLSEASFDRPEAEAMRNLLARAENLLAVVRDE